MPRSRSTFQWRESLEVLARSSGVVARAFVMEVDEAADWRGCQGFEGLETLEESLRCDICKEFLDAPVSVAGCGHSFCSLCIRASLEFQQRAGSPRCPTCRGDASTATLRVNPQLRAAVDSFEKLRGSLLRKLSAGGSSSSGDPQEPESRGVVTRASKSSLRQVVNTERQEVLPKGKTRCPICGVLLSTALAQAHVSYCLEKQERKESGAGAGVRPGAAGVSAGFFTMSGSKRPRSSGAPPKKLPKLVYHILKDRELKSYLQKYHLPTTGDRQEQTRCVAKPTLSPSQLCNSLTRSTRLSRLKQFTHHYNAAADSGKQVSTKSIAGVVLKVSAHPPPSSSYFAERPLTPLQRPRPWLFDRFRRRGRGRGPRGSGLAWRATGRRPRGRRRSASQG